jgi:hypothetical protein
MPYARTPDHIDLFVIGNDDTVWSTYWQAPPHDGSWLDAIGDFFEGAWNVVTTIGGALLDAFDNTFGWLLDIPAFILEALFNIPWVGGLLRNLWNGILTLVWGALSFLDIIAGLLGIRPEKRMRIMIIVQQDEEGEPITGDGQILPPLQRAIDTFKSEANVRLIPVGPFQFSSAFQSVPRASTDYIYREQRPSDSDTLDVNCDSDLLVDDLGVVGSKFNIKLSWDLFFSGWRRLIGYGAPVGVFAVRSFKDGMHTGCSNGPLADWVVVIFAAGDNRTLAHELGHACTLVHPGDTRFWPLSELASKDPCNLMVPGKEGGVGFQLSTGQIVVLRASRHVTYF